MCTPGCLHWDISRAQYTPLIPKTPHADMKPTHRYTRSGGAYGAAARRSARERFSLGLGFRLTALRGARRSGAYRFLSSACPSFGSLATWASRDVEPDLVSQPATRLLYTPRLLWPTFPCHRGSRCRRRAPGFGATSSSPHRASFSSRRRPNRTCPSSCP